MGYRRKREKAAQERKWQRFLLANEALIREARLPFVVTESETHWFDFLDHGILDHHEDLSHFSVNQLDQEACKALRLLIQRYFEFNGPAEDTQVSRILERRLRGA
jgi:hypothetical protein